MWWVSVLPCEERTPPAAAAAAAALTIMDDVLVTGALISLGVAAVAAFIGDRLDTERPCFAYRPPPFADVTGVPDVAEAAGSNREVDLW